MTFSNSNIPIISIYVFLFDYFFIRDLLRQRERRAPPDEVAKVRCLVETMKSFVETMNNYHYGATMMSCPPKMVSYEKTSSKERNSKEHLYFGQQSSTSVVTTKPLSDPLKKNAASIESFKKHRKSKSSVISSLSSQEGKKSRAKESATEEKKKESRPPLGFTRRTSSCSKNLISDEESDSFEDCIEF